MKYFFILTLCIVILTGCEIPELVRFRDYQQSEVITHILNTEEQEQVERRKLDGARVALDHTIYPVAVIVENSADAWPLSGIDDAQIVIEALAESFIPRLLALYSSNTEVPEIGPVRSVRPYFVDFAEPYSAAFMHVGGSPQGLSRVKSGEVVDIDEFRYGGVYFWRDYSRYAPHNVYTSSDLMNEVRADFELNSVPEYKMWEYKDDKPLDERPESVRDIEVNFTTQTYKARWVYDREHNEYVRYQNNSVFTTREGDQIRAKNIIVQVNDTSVIDAIGRKDIDTIGSGDAWIFRDGEVVIGMWEKADSGTRVTYTDSEGNAVALNGGTTWIEVIPNESMLVY